MISDYHDLNIERNLGNTMENILFKNYKFVYSPHLEREPKQKQNLFEQSVRG